MYIVSVRNRWTSDHCLTMLTPRQTPSGLTTDMAYQVNRVGYHFRSVIVEEAMDRVDLDEMHRPLLGPDGIEVIPHSQQEINEQADAALRELFPKIPNTDRGEIINHAFRKVSTHDS